MFKKHYSGKTQVRWFHDQKWFCTFTEIYIFFKCILELEADSFFQSYVLWLRNLFLKLYYWNMMSWNEAKVYKYHFKNSNTENTMLRTIHNLSGLTSEAFVNFQKSHFHGGVVSNYHVNYSIHFCCISLQSWQRDSTRRCISMLSYILSRLLLLFLQLQWEWEESEWLERISQLL